MTLEGSSTTMNTASRRQRPEGREQRAGGGTKSNTGADSRESET